MLNNKIKDLTGEILQILSIKWLRVFIFIFIIFVISWATYGKALDFYFWRDDGKVLWAARYIPEKIFNFSSDAVSRAKIGALFLDYIFIKFFGSDSYNWQTFGLFLKIVNSFLLYHFIKALFKSEKIAVISAILAGSFIGGIEVYTWVRGIALMITFSLLAFTFYIKSYFSRKKSHYLLSLLFTFLVVFIDSFKGLSIIVLIILWEGLMAVSINPLQTVKASLIRVLILVSSFLLIFKVIFSFIGSHNNTSEVTSIPLWILSALKGGNELKFFTSLGNMFRVPFIPTFELAGISNGGLVSIFLGCTFIFSTLVLIISFLKNRKQETIPYLILNAWIILFYIPNWFYEPALIVGSTHRYLAFSALLVPVIWAGFIVLLKNTKQQILALCLILILNFFYANYVNANDYQIRGRDMVIPLWQQMVNDVPFSETNSMLSVTGNPELIHYVFNWSDIFPYASMRGIDAVDKLPVFVDSSKAAQIICNPDTEITDMISNTFVKVGNRYSLSNSYAWEVDKDRRMENTTNQFRITVAKEAICLWKEQDIKLSGNVVLLKTAAIHLFDKNTNSVAVLLNFQNTFPQTNKFQVIANLFNGNKEFIGASSAEVENVNATIVLKFESSKNIDTDGSYIQLNFCQTNCSQLNNYTILSL